MNGLSGEPNQLPCVAYWLTSLLLACEPPGAVPNPRQVIVRPFERLDSTGRYIELRLATEQIYPCINFSLPTTVTRTARGWNLQLGEVDNSEQLCLTAPGPARGGATLGTLPEGMYNLAINNLGRRGSGQLQVSANWLMLQLPPTIGVRAEPVRLGRIPPGTIWGLVGYDTPQHETGVQAFFDALEQAGAKPLRLPEGDYGYFQTTATGQFRVQEMSGYWFAKGFIYQYAGDAATLQRLVREAYVVNNGKVHTNLHTDRGREFFGFQP